MSKKSIISIAVFLYITAVILTTYINLRNDRVQALRYLDINISSAIMQAESMIGRNIILFTHGEDTEAEETEICNIEELSQFCFQAGLEKISFLYEKEGNFIYLADSATDEEMKTGSFTHSNAFYSRDKTLLFKALSQNSPVYSSITDSSGNHRISAKKIYLAGGEEIIILVSVSTAEIIRTANSSFLKSILLSLFFLSFLLPVIVLIISYDRKEKQDLNLEIYYDSLTGLPNRKNLAETYKNARNITMIICNIENLKKYNYYYGYTAGNAILKLISIKLQDWAAVCPEKYRVKPVLFKLQMDEFALIISKSLDSELRTKICRNLVDEFAGNCCNLNNYSIPVSAVFSSAYMTQSGSKKGRTIEDLFILCDMALQNSKNTAETMTIYSIDDMNSVWQGENFHIAQLVKESIENNSIIPYFQPIINNITGEIEKYEALIRIIDKTGELILPKKFLESSKQSRIYPLLTKIMVTKTFEFFKDLDFDFSINISIEDIFNPFTFEFILHTLSENPECAVHCIFEIIDIANIKDATDVMIFTEQIKKHGAKIAIDDFGSNFSNFKSISQIDIDYIKIDPAIIKSLQIDSKSRVIAETIVSYSRKMNIKTIAQFVYNRAVYNEVKSMGVDYSQGYYLGIPSGKVN